jgi:hypothetical protein
VLETHRGLRVHGLDRTWTGDSPTFFPIAKGGLPPWANTT